MALPMAFGPNGDLHVTGYDDGSIYTVTPSGTVSLFVSSSLIDKPQGVAIDPSGNVHVANQFIGIIIKITPSGSA
jgi:hypothetical protein